MFRAAYEDYIPQNTELIFPAGSQIGDKQCLAVPIVDDDKPDGGRFIGIIIGSFHPYVQTVHLCAFGVIHIQDNDGM